MFKRGYYGYKAENKNIKTEYTVEFTRDKKVYDLMETSKFDYDMLDSRKFDYLEDAVSLWYALAHDETILHLMLYETVLLDGEIILEQCKDFVLPSVLDNVSKKRVEQAENLTELYKAENEKLTKYLAKYGIDARKIDNDLNLK